MSWCVCLCIPNNAHLLHPQVLSVLLVLLVLSHWLEVVHYSEVHILQTASISMDKDATGM